MRGNDGTGDGQAQPDPFADARPGLHPPEGPVSLEELTLAYLREPGAARNAETTEVTK